MITLHYSDHRFGIAGVVIQIECYVTISNDYHLQFK